MKFIHGGKNSELTGNHLGVVLIDADNFMNKYYKKLVFVYDNNEAPTIMYQSHESGHYNVTPTHRLSWKKDEINHHRRHIVLLYKGYYIPLGHMNHEKDPIIETLKCWDTGVNLSKILDKIVENAQKYEENPQIFAENAQKHVDEDNNIRAQKRAEKQRIEDEEYKQKKLKEENARKIHIELKTEEFKKGELINLNDFETLCEVNQIIIPGRTLGHARKNVSFVSLTTIHSYGKHNCKSLFSCVRELKYELIAKHKPIKNEKELNHLFGVK